MKPAAPGECDSCRRECCLRCRACHPLPNHSYRHSCSPDVHSYPHPCYSRLRQVGHCSRPACHLLSWKAGHCSRPACHLSSWKAGHCLLPPSVRLLTHWSVHSRLSSGGPNCCSPGGRCCPYWNDLNWAYSNAVAYSNVAARSNAAARTHGSEPTRG